MLLWRIVLVFGTAIDIITRLDTRIQFDTSATQWHAACVGGCWPGLHMIGGAQTARIEWNSVPTPTVEQIFVVHFRRLYKMVPGLFPPT